MKNTTFRNRTSGARLVAGASRNGWKSASTKQANRWGRPYAVYHASKDEVQAPAIPQDDPQTRLQKVEAVLLLAKGPQTARKIAQLANLEDATEARTMIRRLNEVFDEYGRSIRVESIAGGYQLLTRPQFAPWIRRLGHVPAPVSLSSPAMETLAIVAYRQPVMRANIEAIRGVACGELLRQLMERDLVRISGRSEELGRPFLYSTSKRFLQIFGLHSVDALPNIRFDMLPDETSENDEEGSQADLADPQLLNEQIDPSDSVEESDVSIALETAVLGPHSSNLISPDLGGAVALVTETGTDAPTAIIEDEENDWDDEDDDEWDDEEDDWDDDEEEDDWEEVGDDDEDDDDDEEDDDDDADDDDDTEDGDEDDVEFDDDDDLDEDDLDEDLDDDDEDDDEWD
ncbi:hypothetical protein FF011L_55530 [Roseimaritima multifibrata]|uniref:Segregation and condensation protein B n=1 Tax=Roseimaritima multifibrata TaxID=1930274 RepID=A0A517MPD3_9BACT|nr:SMC-Scp complex subunit ScpB [Roseimaritima multifibrata]QDS96740.1 hypothetical protein FF011L_55530 [Roseimaritima multifibrata]